MLHICNSTYVKKQVQIDERASKELAQFSDEAQAKCTALFILLEQDGFLKEPFAKRISDDLFEIRVKHQGQWRAVYAYIKQSYIVILSAFQKKTQKMPQTELKKAQKRLKEYL